MNLFRRLKNIWKLSEYNEFSYSYEKGDREDFQKSIDIHLDRQFKKRKKKLAKIVDLSPDVELD